MAKMNLPRFRALQSYSIRPLEDRPPLEKLNLSPSAHVRSPLVSLSITWSFQARIRLRSIWGLSNLMPSPQTVAHRAETQPCTEGFWKECTPETNIRPRPFLCIYQSNFHSQVRGPECSCITPGTCTNNENLRFVLPLSTAMRASSFSK